MTQAGKQIPQTHSTGGLPTELHLAGHQIQHNKELHRIVIDQIIVACTPTEYRVLALLLEHAEHCVPYARLCALLPATEEEQLLETCDRQNRIRLAHFMSNLRAKLWPLGLDIAAVINTGYLLVSQEQD